MRELILASWYPSKEKPLNGIFFKEQGESLKRHGIDVIVLNIEMVPIRRFGKVKFEKGLTVSEENGIKVYRYKTYNYFPGMYDLYIRYYESILKKVIKRIEVEQGKIDIVHIHSAFDAGIAYGHSGIKIPYVITEHSSRYQRKVINRSEEKLLKYAFINADRIIAVSNGLRSAIEKYAGGKTIDVIPNMVNVKTEGIAVDNSKNKFRFFSLAFLNSYKGMDLIIEAFNNNRQLFKDVELYIGGDGPEYNNLLKLIKEKGLEDNIFLLGMLDREKVYYNMKNCDAFVLPSRVETFGIVFIEAMSYGKPVIGSRTGGPDTFINESCGKVIDIDDIQGLTEAMKEVYLNYDKYDGEYIKQYCQDNFSEDVVVKRLEEIYNDIIGRLQ